MTTRILLAEDDSAMRQFLTAALERAGYAVSPCADGLEALAKLEEDHSYSILLADIVMPGMDGIELSQRAVELYPELKVMFITGFSGIAMGATQRREINARVLSKPFHLNDLVARIEDILQA